MSGALADAVVEVVRVEVAKLALGPGDVLLVKVPKQMERADVWERLEAHLHQCFPDQKVLLSTQDIGFSVIQPPAS